MSEELKQSLTIVVNYLDDKMASDPSRELADVSNYLQALLDKVNA